MGTKENQVSSFGYEQLAVTTVAVGFAGANISKAYGSFIRNRGASDVNWRADGTNPTSTVGQQLKSGEALDFNGQINRLKFICDGAGASATLDADHYA